jgi:hypothetical protein
MGIKMRSGFEKQLWKLAYAKKTVYQAKLSCEFIVNNSQLVERATYIVLVAGFMPGPSDASKTTLFCRSVEETRYQNRARFSVARKELF